MDRPFMPVEDLVDSIAEGCTDYAGGDDPGWFRMRWNQDTSELLLGYEPDNDADPEYRLTEHVFRYGARARVGSMPLGEVAYSGYFTACGGESLISGAELPSWDEQSEEIRAAWQAAAENVRRSL